MKLSNLVLIAFLVPALANELAHAQDKKPLPVTALSVLRSLEPKVTWNSQTVLQADFDCDGLDDYALGGRTGDRYVVGVVQGPLTQRSKHWTLVFSADPGSQGSLCSVVTARIETRGAR